MGISQSLPLTGYVKMIDIWMIFTMSYPFFVITLHCSQEVKARKLNIFFTFNFRFWKIKVIKCLKVLLCKLGNLLLNMTSIILTTIGIYFVFLSVSLFNKNQFRYLEKILTKLQFPILPICGIMFTLIYSCLGLYVYNYPSLDKLMNCPTI